LADGGAGAKTPVVLLTGFLGSGKTTLLQRLLTHPELGETAVIVNELGEAAIDHHLLRRVDDRTVVLGNGCVCCSLRGDLADELRDLLDRRARGEIPRFRRVVVETTGVADPAPIVYTLLSEPVVKHHFELERVIATVDAVHGLRAPESLRQAAAADRLVVTKTDLAPAGELARRLAALNPAADVLEASFGELEPSALLGGEERRPRELPDDAGEHRGDEEHEEHGGDEQHGVRAHTLVFEQPLDWTAFGVWLTMLLAARGADVLRVKGLLDVGGAGPLLLNGVQHVVHPPVHLDAWPDGDRRSRIVFIGRGFTATDLQGSLRAFQGVPGTAGGATV
jgi:G3E family GTPase